MKKYSKLSLSLFLAGMMSVSSAAAAEISLWGDYTGPDGALMTEQIENFNALDNGINLDFSIVPEAQMLEKIPVSISTGTAPTMAIMMNTSMTVFIDANQLRSVDDFFEYTGRTPDDFIDGVIDTFTIDGKLYGLPQDLCAARGLYWNKDLFEAAGLDPETPPTTWDEIFEFAEKLQDPDNGVYGLTFPATDIGTVTSFLRSYGGELFNFETNEVTINTQENIDALTLLQEKVFLPELTPAMVQDNQAGIFAGQYAIFFSGPWLPSGLVDNGINYGITYMPAGSVKAGNIIEGGLYLFFEGSSDEDVKAAYDYINYTYDLENRVKWCTETGFPPTTKDALKDEAVSSNAASKIFAEGMEGSNLLYPFISYSSELENSVFKPMMERIEAGEDVATVLDEAQQQADMIAASH